MNAIERYHKRVAKRLAARMDAGFSEEDHPRDENGRFSSGGGGGGSKSTSVSKDIQKLLNTMKERTEADDHRRKMAQLAQQYHEVRGELQGVIKFMQVEKEIVQENSTQIDAYLEVLETQMAAKEAVMAKYKESLKLQRSFQPEVQAGQSRPRRPAGTAREVFRDAASEQNRPGEAGPVHTGAAGHHPRYGDRPQKTDSRRHTGSGSAETAAKLSATSGCSRVQSTSKMRSGWKPSSPTSPPIPHARRKSWSSGSRSRSCGRKSPGNWPKRKSRPRRSPSNPRSRASTNTSSTLRIITKNCSPIPGS